jgi:hypothetical protein
LESIRPVTRRPPGAATRIDEIDPPLLLDPAEREAQRKERERRRKERERRSTDGSPPPSGGDGRLDVRG